MLKKLFWSKYFTWFRKLVSSNKPDIPWDKILKETDQLALAMGVNPAGENKWQFSTFSGVDVKFHIKPVDGEWIYVPEVAVVSCTYDDPNVIPATYGKIITTVFDRDAIASLPSSPTYTILLEAANEYGHLSHMKLEGVKFGKRTWSMSIEDIISEIHVDFTAQSYKPWTPQKDCPPPYTKEDVERLKEEGRLDELIQMRLDSR